MEVHAHSHTESPPAGRAGKRFTHYLWEFIMLFLAVFCGFLAENFREHQVENQREKKYITSLIKDVELDIVSMKQSTAVKKKYINYYDSLVYLLKNYNENSLGDIYFYARHAGRITDFKYHDGTIQQLKSSGSLRLIRNKNVVDSIIIYDNETIKVILTQQEVYEPTFRIDIMTNHFGKIFNAYEWNEMVDDTAAILRPAYNPKLFNNDPKLINDFLIMIVTLKTSYRLTNGLIEKAIHSAERLIAFLKKEYHLK
jgi:hypothetical protein